MERGAPASLLVVLLTRLLHMYDGTGTTTYTYTYMAFQTPPVLPLTIPMPMTAASGIGRPATEASPMAASTISYAKTSWAGARGCRSMERPTKPRTRTTALAESPGSPIRSAPSATPSPVSPTGPGRQTAPVSCPWEAGALARGAGSVR